MNKQIKNTLLLLLIFIAIPAVATTNDLIFSEDITISDITLSSGTTNMKIFASSSAESFDITNGVFTITNPGDSFNVGSDNINVGTIVILKGSTMESCTVNTVPGTTSVTLPVASGDYIIRPLEATNCGSLCPPVVGVATYNVYPTCGAATCSSGYTLSGSGSSAVCSAQSSSSGGGSYTPPTTTINQDDNITTTQSFEISSDGTSLSSETKTTKSVTGVIEKIEIDTKIKASESIVDTQTIKLNSSETSEVKEMKLELEKEVIEELIASSTNKEIKVNITSKEATTVQRDITAMGDKFLLGYDIFSIDIQVDDNKVSTFSDPLKLTFDISNISDKDNLKVYYFNEVINKWEIAGNGGVVFGNSISVEISHLTDFSLMQDIEEGRNFINEEDVGSLNEREKQMLQIEDDANVVFLSGSDLNTILIHNNVKKDIDKQSKGMNKYIPKLKEGISGLTLNNIYAINNFIMYGSITTRKLGSGERAGVVNSYKKAFGKLPITNEGWKDCIAIANGRWPREISDTAERTAKEEFKNIYLREASMDNPNDNAAITIISYGLRPSDRNIDSEKAGIDIFKNIYKYNPISALDWDIVRAISYSGATR